MGHAVFVFGAAGAGKSTFCKNMKLNSDKNIKLINLDPAQENGADYDLNLCDFITVNEVMEEMDFGPNGALFYALEEMCENLEVLNLEDFEEDYIFIDCPGQIELFLHSNVLQECIKSIKKHSKIAIAYLFDSTIFSNSNKLLYTLLTSAISMSRFEWPILNIISKADLLDEERLEEILEGGENMFGSDNIKDKLSLAIEEYINYNGMTTFCPLDYNKDEMVQNVYLELENLLQRFDDVETKAK